MDTTGERIKNLRKKLGVTQLELAKRFDVDRSTVASWEINRREPDFGTLISLAELYGVTTDYLLCRTDNPQGIQEKKQTPADLAGENIGIVTTERKAEGNVIAFIAEAAGIIELTDILLIENNLTYMNVELTRDDIVTIRHMIEMAMRTRLPKIIPIYPARPPMDLSKIPRIQDIDPESWPLPDIFLDIYGEPVDRYRTLQAEGRIKTDEDWKHTVWNYKNKPPAK